MTVLYFVESVEQVTAESPIVAALRHAFERAPAKRGAMTGPGGNAGVILASDDKRIGYYPDDQVWRRLRGIKGVPVLWIGWYADTPPAPAALQRSAALEGHPVTLADRQQWTIPVARRWVDDGYTRALPAVSTLNDDGEWVSGDVLPEYAALWRVAEQWMSDRETMTTGLANDLASTALGVNYRLSRAEVAALGLLDDTGRTAVEVLNAVIDWPTFAKWFDAQKKTASDQSTRATSDSVRGVADSIPATGPA